MKVLRSSTLLKRRLRSSLVELWLLVIQRGRPSKLLRGGSGVIARYVRKLSMAYADNVLERDVAWLLKYMK